MMLRRPAGPRQLSAAVRMCPARIRPLGWHLQFYVDFDKDPAIGDDLI